MLEITNLTKSYPQRGVVLNKLNLTIKEGDSISVSGPSGSGKTTLLNILGLLDTPDSGDIFFRGKSILVYDNDDASRYRNTNIGFVFQEHLLLPYLTVKENIILPLIPAEITGSERREKEDFADELMSKTGISDLWNKYPSTISGGEAQRAAVVRALINRPVMLLADEPTGSLDKSNSERLAEILMEINADYGTALIVATHSGRLAGKMKARLVLNEGVLVPDLHS